MYQQANIHCETVVASAQAEVMLFSEPQKQWLPPEGNNGLSTVQIMQNSAKHSFRIVAVSNPDNVWILNCNIHHRLKYHTATPTFHQWRDEQRQVYGLNFSSEAEARTFVSVMGQAIDYLNHQMLNAQNDYQSIPHDNVYQDPHQHLPHNHSAPAFRDNDEPSGLHPNFRKSSQGVGQQNGQNGSMLTQQQRRASQGSSNSSNGPSSIIYNQQPAASSSPSRVAPGPPPAPPAPPSGGPPPAPPPPPASFSSQSAPAAPSNAPPAPPPPPPGLMAAKSIGGMSLTDQIKAASQNQLRKTNIKETRSQSLANNSSAPAPTNGGSHGDMLSELAATINKRKMTQAKADAADSKSNTSNGSSDSRDSGIAPPTTANGAKKWEPVKTNGHSANTSTIVGSPKTHRKVPSGSSISSQEDCSPKTNGISNGSSSGTTVVTPEFLERFKADLMVEVRLEINKAKQEIIDVLRAELSRR